MKTTRRLLFALSALLLILGLSSAANAQALNSQQTITLNLNVTASENISLSCTPSTVNFTGYAGSTLTGDNVVTCTSTWNVAPTRQYINFEVWFQNATALTGPSGSIVQNTAVSGSINGGAFNECNTQDSEGAFGCDGGGVTLANNNMPSGWNVGSATTTVAFQIFLAANQPVGQYTGTVLIADIAV